MTWSATVYTPLAVERAALRGALPGLRMVRTGMGPDRARASRVAAGPAVVAGVGGGLDRSVRPGDLVVASEVRAADGAVGCPSAPLLAGALRRLGLRVHVGPILSTPRLFDHGRGAAAAFGALAVDMESAWLAPTVGPFAVVRAIVDTPDHPLWSPGTVVRGVRALRALRRAAPALHQWAAATGARELMSASGRAVRLSDGDAGHWQRRATAVARQSELVLVVASSTSRRASSTSRRLVEVVEREGVPAQVVSDVSQVDLGWLAGVDRIGLLAAVSAPPRLVQELTACLAGLGPLQVREVDVVGEGAGVALSEEVS